MPNGTLRGWGCSRHRRYHSTHVQKHQAAPRGRRAGDRDRDPGGRPAVRPQGQRLPGALQEERGRVQRRRRRGDRGLPAAARGRHPLRVAERLSAPAFRSMGAMPYPLEPGPEQMRAMGEAALGYLVEFVQSQDEGAIEAARSVRGAPPEGPGSFDQLMDTVDLIAANSYNTTGPGFLPFIPGGGLYASALGDFLATGINRFVNMWGQAPVGTQIEHNVVRWLCDLFGYGDDARGILTSGGSMANLSALVAARKARLPEDFLSGTIYASEQVHASNAKAAAIAGFPSANVRSVACTPELRMDVDALREMLA